MGIPRLAALDLRAAGDEEALFVKQLHSHPCYGLLTYCGAHTALVVAAVVPALDNARSFSGAAPLTEAQLRNATACGLLLASIVCMVLTSCSGLHAWWLGGTGRWVQPSSELARVFLTVLGLVCQTIGSGYLAPRTWDQDQPDALGSFSASLSMYVASPLLLIASCLTVRVRFHLLWCVPLCHFSAWVAALAIGGLQPGLFVASIAADVLATGIALWVCRERELEVRNRIAPLQPQPAKELTGVLCQPVIKDEVNQAVLASGTPMQTPQRGSSLESVAEEAAPPELPPSSPPETRILEECGVVVVLDDRWCICHGGLGRSCEDFFGETVHGRSIALLTSERDRARLLQAITTSVLQGRGKKILGVDFCCKPEVTRRDVILMPLLETGSLVPPMVELIISGRNGAAVLPESRPAPETPQQHMEVPEAVADQAFVTLPGSPLAVASSPGTAEGALNMMPEPEERTLLADLPSASVSDRDHSSSRFLSEGLSSSVSWSLSSPEQHRSSASSSSSLAYSASPPGTHTQELDILLETVQETFSGGLAPPVSAEKMSVDMAVQVNQPNMVETDTETDIVWDRSGWRCKNCTKPPLPPGTATRAFVASAQAEQKGKRAPKGFDGLWTILVAHQHMAFSWLFRICVRGKDCIDNDGNRWKLEEEGGRTKMAGGFLMLEGQNILHRDGRTGVRLTFSRGDGGREIEGALQKALASLGANPRGRGGAGRHQIQATGGLPQQQHLLPQVVSVQPGAQGPNGQGNSGSSENLVTSQSQTNTGPGQDNSDSGSSASADITEEQALAGMDELDEDADGLASGTERQERSGSLRSVLSRFGLR